MCAREREREREGGRERGGVTCDENQRAKVKMANEHGRSIDAVAIAASHNILGCVHSYTHFPDRCKAGVGNVEDKRVGVVGVGGGGDRGSDVGRKSREQE